MYANDNVQKNITCYGLGYRCLIYDICAYFQVLFDSNGVLRKFESVDQIFREFFHMRLEVYQKRKDYLEGMLSAESLKLDNIARFIMEKIDGTIVVGGYSLKMQIS